MRKIILVFLIVHFSIIIFHLFAGVFKSSKFSSYTSYYVTPLFEQTWSMFSIPPTTNRVVFFQYAIVNTHSKDSDTTRWFNVSLPLNRQNEKLYFSIYQRLIKYQSATINNFLKTMKYLDCSLEGTTIKDISCIKGSIGYVSLKSYAKWFYENNLSKGEDELVYFKIKISEHSFPRIEDAFKKVNDNFYEEINTPYALLSDKVIKV